MISGGFVFFLIFESIFGTENTQLSKFQIINNSLVNIIYQVTNVFAMQFYLTTLSTSRSSSWILANTFYLWGVSFRNKRVSPDQGSPSWYWEPILLTLDPQNSAALIWSFVCAVVGVRDYYHHRAPFYNFFPPQTRSHSGTDHLISLESISSHEQLYESVFYVLVSVIYFLSEFSNPTTTQVSGG